MYENIPNWLVGDDKYQIFCTHKNKVPTHNTHIDDMSTFYTYSQAMRLMQPDEGLGIGLFGNLCGIDIDHAVNEDGSLSQTAKDIIDYFDGAYMEYSYSGKGVHILFFCAQQRKYQKYYTKMGVKQLTAKGITDIEGLEFYQGRVDNRYLTLTGNIIPQRNKNNYSVTPQKITAFLDKYFIIPVQPKSHPTSTSSNTKEDLAWARFGLYTLKDEKFKEAFDKPATGYGGTESEDDLTLACRAAFWTNNNPEAIRIVFEASPHYKTKDADHLKKWSKKYSDDTISKALSDSIAKEYYTLYEYNEETDKIVRKEEDSMVAPQVTTRISQKGETLAVIDTKTFKFEAPMPQLKKNTTTNERTVKWVSSYKKGSEEPSSFLNRTDPAFELVAGIVLERF